MVSVKTIIVINRETETVRSSQKLKNNHLELGALSVQLIENSMIKDSLSGSIYCATIFL